jgi:hypothetical protein
MGDMEWPSIEDVADRLRDFVEGIDTEDEDGGGIEVRLQVHDGGAWSVHTGDPSYDTDHRGFWGSAYLDAEEDVREVASDLIEQAREMFIEQSE